MKRARFTDEQIIAVLCEREAGAKRTQAGPTMDFTPEEPGNSLK